MPLIPPTFIAVLAVITAIFASFTAYRWRGFFIPIHWTAFLAMAFGALAVGAFYMGIAVDYDLYFMIRFSRIIFAFILLSTLLMCIGAIAIHKNETTEYE